MYERVQSDITKGKISSSLDISVQVFHTLKEETIVYESKKLATKYLDTSDSTIGRYIKSRKLLFSRYLIS